MTQRRTPRVTFTQNPPMRVGRFRLAWPRMRHTLMADGGVLTERAPRNPIGVGNLVVLHNSQSSRIRDWRIQPGQVVGHTMWIQREPSPALALITDISPDRRLIRYRRILTGWAASYSLDVEGHIRPRERWVTGDVITNWQRTLDQVRRGPEEPVTEDEFRQSSSLHSTEEESIGRVSHIRALVSPDSLPAGLIDYMRSASYAIGHGNVMTRLAGLDTRRDRTTGASRRDRIRAALFRRDTVPGIQKRVASYIKQARETLAHDPEDAHYYIHEAINRAQGSLNTYPRQADYFTRLDRTRNGILKAVAGRDMRAEFHACSHYTVNPLVGPTRNEYEVVVGISPMSDSPLQLGSVCPACREHHVHPAEIRGAIHRTLGTTVALYRWVDGVYRTRREPAIIGSYHSSKNVVGYTPPLKPHKGQWPTMGFELEVQGVNDEHLNRAAREMRKFAADALGVSEAASSTYLNFEEDGSLDNGFELVSGWTDLATHATVMKKVLEDESGRNRWVGRLRSHNASCSCGLHVHIQKPDSLVHGMKVRYFMSSPVFKDLIKAVARRWDADYAHVAGRNDSREPGSTCHRDFCNPAKSAALYYKSTKNPYSYSARARDKKEHLKNVTKRMMLNGDRYEHTNFHNAKTIEFRIYRGTTLYSTFMACLEMTQAVWMYCRDTPASAMSVDSFLAFLNDPHNAQDTRHLRARLKAKGFAARVPNAPKNAAAAAPVLEEATA